MQAGDWFGESALIYRGGKRTTSVIAVTGRVLLQLRQENFQSFLQITPEAEQAMKTRIEARTAEYLRKVPFFDGIVENKPWSKLDLLGSLFVFEEMPEGEIVFDQVTHFIEEVEEETK